MSTYDPRPSVQAPDEDPYLWLEEIEGKDALDWVATQNSRTMDRYGGAAFTADRDTLAAIFDRPDNIPFIARRGGLLYNFWRDEQHPRGLWRRTSMEEFRKDSPDWEILLDLDALAAAEGEDWVWHGSSTLPPAHERAMLRLSRGGSDAVVLREFDLRHKAFVEGGFHLPEAKGGVEWLDADTLLLISAHGAKDLQTTSGYARTVRLWRRGTDPLSAPVIFEVGAGSVMAIAFVDRTVTQERIYFVDRAGFFEMRISIGDRTGARTQLDLPHNAWIDLKGDWFALKTRAPWTSNGHTYPTGTVIGGSLPGLLNGEPDLHVLFEDGERIAVQHLFWLGDRQVLAILDNLKRRYVLFAPGHSGWERTELGGLPESGVAFARRLDIEEAESNGDLVLNTQDPLTPATLSLVPAGAPPVVLKRAPSVFDPSGLTVSRHEAVSVDGESIPYVQVGPAGETGNAPVLMNGYGGFELAREAFYNGAVGKLWLERGGTYVLAHIRGGGEFGTRWHDAGRREGKRLSHDDFAAVAADLVRRGVTRPKRIAAEGGSNGGLLITNMLTRYPDRFGALFCTIPLIDMRRYTKLLAGPSWVDEYGDPDKPEEWAFLQSYSAYHLARPGEAYPPILIATSRKDDRVHPGHARKMAAKLSAMGYEQAYFYEPEAGGHGYGKDNRERAAFTALGYRFLRAAIGWGED